MAKSYTLYETTAPVISVAGIAGGSLIEGVTYHVVVLGIFGSNWYNLGIGRQVSPPSNEATFTADATNKSFEITIDTDATGVVAVSIYVIYIYTSDDSDATFNGTTVDGTILTRAYNGSGTVANYGYGLVVADFPYTVSNLSRASSPYYTQGIPELQFNGGTYADPITPKNIYDYLVTQGKEKYMDRLAQLSKLGVERCFGYIFYLHLYSLSSTNHFKIPDRQICIFGHKQSLLYMAYMYTGNMDSDGSCSGNYPWGGAVIYQFTRHGWYPMYKNFVMYNGTILYTPPNITSGFASTGISNPEIQFYTAITIEDGNYHAKDGRFSGVNMIAKNLNANFGAVAMGVNPGSTIEEIKMYGILRTHYSGAYDDVTVRQVNQVSTISNRNFYYFNYSNRVHSFKIYDSKLYYEPSYSNTWLYNSIPNAVYEGGTHGLYIGFSFNVKVVDKNNIPIQNAPVILKDRDGNELINTTTDENGDITETDINALYMDYKQPAVEDQPPALYRSYQQMYDLCPDYTTLKDYRPFTLTVSKDKYETMEMIINPQQSDWYPLGIRRTVALQKTFVVKSIHSKASKSAYNEGDIAEISGGVTLANDLSGVSVLMEIRKASDDSIVAILLDTTYDFLADVEVSYETLNGGSNPTWDTAANIDEFYFRILLSHTDLEGDKEDKEYFYAGLAELEPELIELLDEMEIIEMDEEDLELIEIE